MMKSNHQLQRIRDAAVRRRPPARPILLALTGLASLCAVLTVSDCSFMLSARYDFDASQVGLFSQAMFDLDGRKLGCLRYPDKNQMDGMFRAGRAFGVITPMLVLAAFISMAIALLWCPARWYQRLWSASKFALAASTVTQMFVFFAVGSDFMCPLRDCKLAAVGILAAFNVLLLAGLSIGLFVNPAPTAPWLVRWEPPNRRPTALELPGVDPEVVHYIYGQQRRHRVGTEEEGANGSNPGAAAITVIDQYPTEEEPAPLDDAMHYGWSPTLPAASGDEGSHPRGDASDSSSANSTVSSALGLQNLTSFRLIFLSLVFFAWAVSIAGVQRCSFLMVGPVGEDISHYRGLGLFTRAMYYDGEVLGCLAYPDRFHAEFDSAFVASRVFGSLTALLMTLVLLLLVLQFFLDRARREVWVVVRVLLPCATLFQLFAFSVYRTETCHGSDQVVCIPGQLGIWVILNVILMTMLSVLVLVMPPPPHPVFTVRPPLSDGPSLLETTSDRRSALSLSTAPPDIGPVRLTSARLRYAPAILEPKGLKLLRLPRYAAKKKAPATFEEEDTATAVLSEDGPERILRIDPLSSRPPSFEELPSSPPAQFITVTVEYHGMQKRVVKTLTHPDGSQTITTTIEELGNDCTANEGEETDCSILSADDADSEEDETAGVASVSRDRTDSRIRQRPPSAPAVRPAQNRIGTTHDVREVYIMQDRGGDRNRWEAGSDTDGEGSLTVDTCMVDEKEYYSDTA